jgi:alpha-galactosidase
MMNGPQSLLTNDAVLGVNQDSLGAPGVLVSPRGMQEAWKKPLADGSLAVALFNRASELKQVSVTWKGLGLEGVKSVRDLWSGKDVAIAGDGLEMDLPPHGSMLVRVVPVP